MLVPMSKDKLARLSLSLWMYTKHAWKPFLMCFSIVIEAIYFLKYFREENEDHVYMGLLIKRWELERGRGKKGALDFEKEKLKLSQK